MSECGLKDYFMRHGNFSWNELMTPDLEKSKAFYGGIFGWTFKEDTIAEGPMAGQPYVVAHNGETMAGGMIPAPTGQEVPPHWGAYVTVDNMDQTLAKVKGTRRQRGHTWHADQRPRRLCRHPGHHRRLSHAHGIPAPGIEKNASGGQGAFLASAAG